MITGEIENADTDDLFVWANDLNTSDQQMVLDGVRINEHQSSVIEIQEDGNGKGRVHWRAVRANDASKVREGDCSPVSREVVPVSAS